MSRPTKYNDKILSKAKEYLFDWEREGHAIPMIEGLAKVLDIHKDTIYAWEQDEDKKEFSDVVKKIREAQHMELLMGGLTNKFNASITKLALTKHGYSDKQEQALTGPGGTALGVSITFHDADEEA